jgi:hypothetical protein
MTAGQLSVKFDMQTAISTTDERYRFNLTRAWTAGEGTVCWVMLNPSTADADQDDPTIRKCVGFSKAWGYKRLVVVNLFAWRSTDPKGLRSAPDPIGDGNDHYIREASATADLVVCAWGANAPKNGPWADRAFRVRLMLLGPQGRPIFHLGLTKGGQPSHPLMLPYSTPRVRWENRR